MDGHPLNTWNDQLDSGTVSRVRQWGRYLLWVGAATLLAGMFLTPPWMNGGLIAALLGALLARPPLHRLAASWFGVAFAGWVLLTVALAVLRGQPQARVAGIAHGWLALPLVAAAAQDPRWRRQAFKLMVAIGTLSMTIALLQFTIGLGSGIPGISANGERLVQSRGLNTLHLTLGFTAALFAVLAPQPASLWGVATRSTWVGRIAALTGLGICGSRAGSFAGIAGLGATLAARGRRWCVVGLVIGIGLASLLIARMAFTESHRLWLMLHGQDGRWPIWTASLAIAEEHPWFGVGGRRAYRVVYNDTYARVLPGVANEFGPTGGAPHAHNWLLAEAAEHGFPAPILHLALVIAVLVASWRRRLTHPAGWRVSVGVATVALVGAQFEPYPTQSVAGLAFHACLGLGLGLALARNGATADSAPCP